MIYYPSHEIFRYQKLPHAFQTLRKIFRSNTTLFQVHKRKLIKLYWSHLFDMLIVRQFLVNQPSDKRILNSPICNLSCNPKLMQRHYKLRKIEKNRMNGIIFFFSAKFFVYLSTLFPMHLFAIRGRLQRWEEGIRGTSKIPISQLF